MRSSLIPVSVLVASAQIASGQDAASILETMRQRQIERWEGVQVYMVDQTLAGQRMQVYYKRIDVEDEKGESHPAFIQMTKTELDEQKAEAAGMQTMTADQLEQAAQAHEMVGDVMATQIENGLEKAGLPRGLLAATGSKPWNTLNPRVMLGGGAMFLRAAAEAKRRGQSDRIAAAGESLDDMAEFVTQARLVGTEKVDGRSAFHLRAEGIDHVQDVEGQEFKLQNVSMWVDTEHLVPLRFKAEGTAISGGESRPIFMQKHDSDFRAVPDSDLYEPFNQTMSIGGIMNEKQQKELQEAQQKLAEFEKQMEQMPEAQKKMIMDRMGPQMEMMKKMASSGGFETVVRVHEIRVLE